MSELLSSQSKVKYLTSAKEGKYKVLNKNAESREVEWQRQVAKLESLQDIMERLQSDFRDNQQELRNLSLSIKSKLASNTQQSVMKETIAAI